MNKIKIGIFSLVTAISTTFATEVEQSTPYFNIEGGYIQEKVPCILNLNLGYRLQKNHNGLDVGLGINPILYYNFNTYGYVNYLYYFDPDPHSQYYVGVGSQIGYRVLDDIFSEASTWYAKPQLLIGKEFQVTAREKHFIQLSVGNYFNFSDPYQTYLNSKKPNNFNPSVTLSYGITF